MARVIVVGAGIVGLSCALRLLEAGHRVDVVARDLPLETTSTVAAALVLPYRVGPADAVARWTAESRDHFAALAETEPDAGVRMLSGTEVGADPADRVEPVVEPAVHLRWLVGRVEALGGTITRLNLGALPPTGTGTDLVVNCSGLGARLLGSDRTVAPVAGQVVVLEQWGLDRWVVEAADPARPTYVVPREREVVVGGTADEGEWSRTPSQAVAADVLRRAAVLVPEVATARVLRHKVGLRPARPQVRLERVDDVVHCYGHGGAGVTLAWGCAGAVVELVAAG